MKLIRLIPYLWECLVTDKLAIEYGSNLVRIGTAIFGARTIKTQGDDN
jgi:hypothetical protein